MSKTLPNTYLESLHHQRGHRSSLIRVHVGWNAQKQKKVIAVHYTHRVEVAHNIATSDPPLFGEKYNQNYVNQINGGIFDLWHLPWCKDRLHLHKRSP